MNISGIFKLSSFFQFLGKNKLYTFIEVFGLSVSLMFVILIAGYTRQELSTDNFHRNKDRLYFLAGEKSFGFAYRLADRIKDRYPEIEKVCPMMNVLKKAMVQLPESKMNADLVFADSTFFNMLSFEIIQGDKQTPLAARNYAVISESFARKAFPGQDPLGKPLRLQDSVSVTVNAVMKDIRNSVVPYGDIILRIDNIKYWNEGLASDTYSNYGMVPILVQAVPGADLKAKESDLLEYLKENVWMYQHGKDVAVSFVPIKEVYFSPIEGHGGLLLNQGNKMFVLILFSVGILILVFAIINYINLTVAQTGFRAKEMATRRLLGSSRGELFARLIMESTLLTFISFFIGLLLAYLFVPAAGNLLETKITLSGLMQPFYIALTLVLLAVIGALSGLLPAWVISNAKPVDVVKGTFRQQTKMVFSKVFITFQNVITIALVTASLVMVLQIDHLVKAPLGYNTHNLVDVNVMEVMDGDKQAVLTVGNEFARLASVKRVGYGQGMPFNAGNNYSYHKDGKNISFQSFVGDSTYFRMLGFDILRDNHVAGGNAFFLSQQAFRELELDEDAESFNLEPFFAGNVPIAGMVKDFQIRSIVAEPRPTLLRMQKVEEFHPWNIVVETAGDPYQAYKEIKAVYERITNLEFPGKFIDRQIEESFAQQRRTSKILILFACIAILLSLLGLIAMSTYFIQQRSREIAVRKVFGSSISQVLARLLFTFLNYVVIAFVVVTPLVWYLMRQWLSGYSYRISLNPWIFICSGLFCLLLAFVTVFWQSYRAAAMNPVVSIKTE